MHSSCTSARCFHYTTNKTTRAIHVSGEGTLAISVCTCVRGPGLCELCIVLPLWHECVLIGHVCLLLFVLHHCLSAKLCAFRSVPPLVPPLARLPYCCLSLLLPRYVSELSRSVPLSRRQLHKDGQWKVTARPTGRLA